MPQHDAQTIVKYADHDKHLQKQVFRFRNGNLGVLYIRRVICDERKIGSMKILVIFASPQNFKLDRLNTGDIKCLVNGNLTNTLKTFYTSEDILMFPFVNSLECPEKISLFFNWNKSITNQLKVERQYKKSPTNSRHNMSIVLCSPAITKMMDISSPRRLIEYIEYQRAAGVHKMVLAEFNERFYKFTLAETSRKVLDYYKKLGFLETFQVSLTSNHGKSLYELADSTKPAQFTYCMLKNALISNYVIAQDLDEIVGFNTTRYSNLQEAISAAEDKNYSFSSFYLQDQPIARRCMKYKDLAENSSFLIVNSTLFYRIRFHGGKTVHSSQTCQVVSHHYCVMARNEDTINSNNLFTARVGIRVSDPNFSTIINLHFPKGTEIMRNLHFRDLSLKDFREHPKNESERCEPENLVSINWLQKISDRLLFNSETVLKKLNLDKSEN